MPNCEQTQDAHEPGVDGELAMRYARLQDELAAMQVRLRRGEQPRHPQQVVGAGDQLPSQLHASQSAIAKTTDRFQPANYLLNAFPQTLARGVPAWRVVRDRSHSRGRSCSGPRAA